MCSTASSSLPATGAQRAAAHRELAEALHDQPDRRAWHLAAAALQPDEHVAALLEATAAQAQRRGGAAAAALAMERAAELSPDPEDQARRLVAAASAAVPTGQGDWVQDLAARALAVTADPELRLTARHDAGWALAWSGRRTDALSALISVAEEASRDLPALAWDALGSAATVAYQSGTPASRQAVSRALGLLERQGPPPPGRAPGIDVNALRLWIRASADPIGSRNQLLPYLRKIAGSPIEEPSLWRIASAAWLLDESDLAIRLLQDAMQRLRAPGVRGTSGGSLTVLGWAYIDTGRWDEALDVAAEAASLAEANQMELVAASADVITATVLALRADSGAARRHAARALATVDPAECGLVAARARRALGVAALADGSYLQAFTQLRGLFSEDGTPLHNYASYLGVADLAAAAVRADRRMEGCDVIEHALSRLDGIASARLEQLIAACGSSRDPKSNAPSRASSHERQQPDEGVPMLSTMKAPIGAALAVLGIVASRLRCPPRWRAIITTTITTASRSTTAATTTPTTTAVRAMATAGLALRSLRMSSRSNAGERGGRRIQDEGDSDAKTQIRY